jgi:hypothetical protein
MICQHLGFPCVPLIGDKELLPSTDVKYWLEKVATITYDQLSDVKGLPAEGLVIKSADDQTPYISCKIISREYLEKYNL